VHLNALDGLSYCGLIKYSNVITTKMCYKIYAILCSFRVACPDFYNFWNTNFMQCNRARIESNFSGNERAYTMQILGQLVGAGICICVPSSTKIWGTRPIHPPVEYTNDILAVVRRRRGVIIYINSPNAETPYPLISAVQGGS